MSRMDIERVVAKRILDATETPTVLEVPKDRPDEFVSVELTGSTGTRFVRTCTLAVQSWAKTRKRAAEIARLVEDAVYELTNERNIFSATPTGSYRWPDPDSRQERYQTTVELIVCE